MQHSYPLTDSYSHVPNCLPLIACFSGRYALALAGVRDCVAPTVHHNRLCFRFRSPGRFSVPLGRGALRTANLGASAVPQISPLFSIVIELLVSVKSMRTNGEQVAKRNGYEGMEIVVEGISVEC